ncbi:MAG: DUF1365 domain-containing protein [Gammaproteobacteria bacterium]|nr:DUF1365 domain-containing protein [Gammaproteobacteria bacterium]
MDTDPAACLYSMRIGHQRRVDAPYRFEYRFLSILIDLAELESTADRCRLFSHNRFNLLSLYDRDHGLLGQPAERAGGRVGPRARASDEGGVLLEWVRNLLARQSIGAADGRVRLLCFPRVLGLVFNPLSIWYCETRDGELVAVVCEVHNTFGERHAYVLPVAPEDAARGVVAQSCAKDFYVSPFIGMEATYAFRIKPPAESVSVLIRERDGEGEFLRATLSGRRMPLTDRMLLRAFCAYPLMTLKVLAGIHWQALRLWRKGAKYHKHVARRPSAGATVAPSAAPPPAVVGREQGMGG